MNLLYVVGPPGVGKSTLVAGLTARMSREAVAAPVPHDRLLTAQLGIAGAEVGKRRGAFSGTDALSMSIHPKAVEWISTAPYDLVIGEGARLGTRGFLTAGMKAGYWVTLVHLTAAQDVLDARCKERGSAQNETWRRGAATRAARLAATMDLDARVLRLDASAPADQLAAQVRGVVRALGVLG